NWITWQTVINSYFNPKAAVALNKPADSTESMLGDNRGANIFLCPSAPRNIARSSYVCNMVAMPDKDFEEEYTDTSKQPLLQPAQLSKLYSHNILLFDSGAVVNTDAIYACGYDVDYQYFLDPGDTQARFFRGDDPYNGNKYR